MNSINCVAFCGNGESAGVPAYSTSVKKSQCPPNVPCEDSVNFKSNAYVEPKKRNSFVKWGIGLAGAAAVAIGGLGYVRKAGLINKLSDGWFKNIAKKAEPLTETCYTLCSKAKTWGVEVFDKIKGFLGKG